MSQPLQCNIHTPNGLLFSGAVSRVVLQDTEGQYEVHAEHENTLSRLVPSTLEMVNLEGHHSFIYISGGFAQVTGKEVLVVADEAIRSEELDEARIQAAKVETLRLLESVDPVDHKEHYDQIHIQLLQIMAQLSALRRKG